MSFTIFFLVLGGIAWLIWSFNHKASPKSVNSVVQDLLAKQNKQEVGEVITDVKTALKAGKLPQIIPPPGDK